MNNNHEKILFRSWNETDLQYYYFENGEYYYLDEETKVPIGEAVFNWNNAEQYTGLKDKNGNKIFEGDVAETHKIGSIHWDEEYLEYFILYNNQDESEALDTGFSDDIAVIGNIHGK